MKKIISVVLCFICLLLVVNKCLFSTNLNLDNIAAFKISYKDLDKIYSLSQKYNIEFTELLTYYSLSNNFFDEKFEVSDNIEQNFILNYATIKNNYNSKEANKAYTLLYNIIDEIESFPVEGDNIEFSYSDSWGAERTYGGKRIHKGTDIFDKENISGRLKIVSMTDGVVEKLGWNEKGGYRVGIRSKNGNYYYYAHLEKYSDIEINSSIKAGDVLGYMGNSGYGNEGTTGKFPVHLHLGINPDTRLTSNEFWINPYPFLRIVEIKNKV